MAGGKELKASYVDVTIQGRTEKIHYLTAGPPRSPPTPAVIFISGLGTPCLGFATVMRQLAKAGIHSCAPDRAGVGRSPGSFAKDKADESAETQKGTTERTSVSSPTRKSPEEARSAIQMAEGLAAFLGNAKILPPYILAQHSYGGVIAREFIANHKPDVLGAVFIDANCENAMDRGINIQELDTLMGCEGINFWEDTGLAAQQQLEPQEWAELTKGGELPPGFERGAGGGKAESMGYIKSVRGLRRLQQYEEHVLAKKPISVVKGTIEPQMIQLLNLADRRNAGPKKLRDSIRAQFVRFNENELRLQRAQLKLAEEGCGRMVDVKEAGHYVHISHPDVVSKEIQWVYEQAHERGFIEDWKAAHEKTQT